MMTMKRLMTPSVLCVLGGGVVVIGCLLAGPGRAGPVGAQGAAGQSNVTMEFFDQLLTLQASLVSREKAKPREEAFRDGETLADAQGVMRVAWVRGYCRTGGLVKDGDKEKSIDEALKKQLKRVNEHMEKAGYELVPLGYAGFTFGAQVVPLDVEQKWVVGNPAADAMETGVRDEYRHVLVSYAGPPFRRVRVTWDFIVNRATADCRVYLSYYYYADGPETPNHYGRLELN